VLLKSPPNLNGHLPDQNVGNYLRDRRCATPNFEPRCKRARRLICKPAEREAKTLDAGGTERASRRRQGKPCQLSTVHAVAGSLTSTVKQEAFRGGLRLVQTNGVKPSRTGEYQHPSKQCGWHHYLGDHLLLHSQAETSSGAAGTWRRPNVNQFYP
jgi:hypothetical protein